MERVLYVVAREQPLLAGYLMTRVAARSAGGHVVEIKVDERRGERRLAREARDPERRSGERRLRPSLDRDLRSRGYATVVQSEASSSWTGEPTSARAIAWRPRSTWGQRVARAGRRSRVRWGLIVLLLAAVGVSIVVARSIRGTPAPPPPAPQIEEAPPPPPASKAETIVPAAAGRLRVELAPDARVVRSERAAQARRGEYMVEEVEGPEGKELARSVVMTFRPH